MFTLMPSAASAFVALRPSFVIGSFTTMFLWIFASSVPSATILSASRLTASALIGPSTMEQISAITCLKSRPSRATSDGLVVTPSTIPRLAASRISLTFAVSMKNFMVSLSYTYPMLRQSPPPAGRLLPAPSAFQFRISVARFISHPHSGFRIRQRLIQHLHRMERLDFGTRERQGVCDLHAATRAARDDGRCLRGHYCPGLFFRDAVG